MATRRYSKKAKARKKRTYRGKKSKRSTLTKQQKATFFALMSGKTLGEEE